MQMWQSLDTAPKDGTWIKAQMADGEVMMARWRENYRHHEPAWHDQRGIIHSSAHPIYIGPVLWMPQD